MIFIVFSDRIVPTIVVQPEGAKISMHDCQKDPESALPRPESV
jgi:hypothetical protein